MTWYRNSVRHISLCFLGRDSSSVLYNDGRSNLLLFSNDCGLFDWSRRRAGSSQVSRTRATRGTFRLLLVWIWRGLRLESLRNGLANFLEKVSNRVRIYASSAQKEQRGHWQRNPARTKKTVD